MRNYRDSGYLSLKKHIADVIRNAIIDGELTPGLQLQQDKIAAAMGVSSIPVREALSILGEELYVTYHPNRGTFVAGIDAEKVREAYEIRYFLEAGALSLSLPGMTDKDFKEAERLMILGMEETDVNRKVELDLTFHMALCRPCARPYLIQLIEQLHGHTARFVNLSVYLMDFKPHPLFHHGKLFSECRKKDIDGAARVLKNHLQYASDLICEKYEP